MAASEITRVKSLFVLAIVVGCFAVLWPKVFYPMFQGGLAPEAPPLPRKDDSICCGIVFEMDTYLQLVCTHVLHKDLRFARGSVAKQALQECRENLLEKCLVDIRAPDYKPSQNLTLCLRDVYGVDDKKLNHRPNGTVHNPRHMRPERPHHLHPEAMHPGLREKGRTIPPSYSDIKQGRPPIGIRPPMGAGAHVVNTQKGVGAGGGGAMSIVMPIYTIGIVVFFVYTIMKVMFKKQPESEEPIVKDFGMDAEHRKFLYEAKDDDETPEPEISKRFDEMQQRSRVPRSEASVDHTGSDADASETAIPEPVLSQPQETTELLTTQTKDSQLLQSVEEVLSVLKDAIEVSSSPFTYLPESEVLKTSTQGQAIVKEQALLETEVVERDVETQFAAEEATPVGKEALTKYVATTGNAIQHQQDETEKQTSLVVEEPFDENETVTVTAEGLEETNAMKSSVKSDQTEQKDDEEMEKFEGKITVVATTDSVIQHQQDETEAEKRTFLVLEEPVAGQETVTNSSAEALEEATTIESSAVTKSDQTKPTEGEISVVVTTASVIQPQQDETEAEKGKSLAVKEPVDGKETVTVTAEALEKTTTMEPSVKSDQTEQKDDEKLDKVEGKISFVATTDSVIQHHQEETEAEKRTTLVVEEPVAGQETVTNSSAEAIEEATTKESSAVTKSDQTKPTDGEISVVVTTDNVIQPQQDETEAENGTSLAVKEPFTDNSAEALERTASMESSVTIKSDQTEPEDDGKRNECEEEISVVARTDNVVNQQQDETVTEKRTSLIVEEPVAAHENVTDSSSESLEETTLIESSIALRSDQTEPESDGKLEEAEGQKSVAVPASQTVGLDETLHSQVLESVTLIPASVGIEAVDMERWDATPEINTTITVPEAASIKVTDSDVYSAVGTSDEDLEEKLDNTPEDIRGLQAVTTEIFARSVPDSITETLIQEKATESLISQEKVEVDNAVDVDVERSYTAVTEEPLPAAETDDQPEQVVVFERTGVEKEAMAAEVHKTEIQSLPDLTNLLAKELPEIEKDPVNDRSTAEITEETGIKDAPEIFSFENNVGSTGSPVYASLNCPDGSEEEVVDVETKEQGLTDSAGTGPTASVPLENEVAEDRSMESASEAATVPESDEKFTAENTETAPEIISAEDNMLPINSGEILTSCGVTYDNVEENDTNNSQTNEQDVRMDTVETGISDASYSGSAPELTAETAQSLASIKEESVTEETEPIPACLPSDHTEPSQEETATTQIIDNDSVSGASAGNYKIEGDIPLQPTSNTETETGEGVPSVTLVDEQTLVPVDGEASSISVPGTPTELNLARRTSEEGHASLDADMEVNSVRPFLHLPEFPASDNTSDLSEMSELKRTEPEEEAERNENIAKEDFTSAERTKEVLQPAEPTEFSRSEKIPSFRPCGDQNDENVPEARVIEELPATGNENLFPEDQVVVTADDNAVVIDKDDASTDVSLASLSLPVEPVATLEYTPTDEEERPENKGAPAPLEETSSEYVPEELNCVDTDKKEDTIALSRDEVIVAEVEFPPVANAEETQMDSEPDKSNEEKHDAALAVEVDEDRQMTLPSDEVIVAEEETPSIPDSQEKNRDVQPEETKEQKIDTESAVEIVDERLLEIESMIETDLSDFLESSEFPITEAIVKPVKNARVYSRAVSVEEDQGVEDIIQRTVVKPFVNIDSSEEAFFDDNVEDLINQAICDEESRCFEIPESASIPEPSVEAVNLSQVEKQDTTVATVVIDGEDGLAPSEELKSVWSDSCHETETDTIAVEPFASTVENREHSECSQAIETSSCLTTGEEEDGITVPAADETVTEYKEQANVVAEETLERRSVERVVSSKASILYETFPTELEFHEQNLTSNSSNQYSPVLTNTCDVVEASQSSPEDPLPLETTPEVSNAVGVATEEVKEEVCVAQLEVAAESPVKIGECCSGSCLQEISKPAAPVTVQSADVNVDHAIEKKLEELKRQKELEMDLLRRRLEETEAAMERIVAQMGSASDKLLTREQYDKDLTTTRQRLKQAEEHLERLKAATTADDVSDMLSAVSDVSLLDVTITPDESALEIPCEDQASGKTVEVIPFGADAVATSETKISVVGMEVTAQAVDGSKVPRPPTPTRQPTPKVTDPDVVPFVLLDALVPSHSHLLVSEAECRAEAVPLEQLDLDESEYEASPVVLSGKMTLSVMGMELLMDPEPEAMVPDETGAEELTTPSETGEVKEASSEAKSEPECEQEVVGTQQQQSDYGLSARVTKVRFNDQPQELIIESYDEYDSNSESVEQTLDDTTIPDEEEGDHRFESAVIDVAFEGDKEDKKANHPTRDELDVALFDIKKELAAKRGTPPRADSVDEIMRQIDEARRPRKPILAESVSADETVPACSFGERSYAVVNRIADLTATDNSVLSAEEMPVTASTPIAPVEVTSESEKTAAEDTAEAEISVVKTVENLTGQIIETEQLQTKIPDIVAELEVESSSGKLIENAQKSEESVFVPQAVEENEQAQTIPEKEQTEIVEEKSSGVAEASRDREDVEETNASFAQGKFEELPLSQVVKDAENTEGKKRDSEAQLGTETKVNEKQNDLLQANFVEQVVEKNKDLGSNVIESAEGKLEILKGKSMAAEASTESKIRPSSLPSIDFNKATAALACVDVQITKSPDSEQQPVEEADVEQKVSISTKFLTNLRQDSLHEADRNQERLTHSSFGRSMEITELVIKGPKIEEQDEEEAKSEEERESEEEIQQSTTVSSQDIKPAMKQVVLTRRSNEGQELQAEIENAMREESLPTSKGSSPDVEEYEMVKSDVVTSQLESVLPDETSVSVTDKKTEGSVQNSSTESSSYELLTQQDSTSNHPSSVSTDTTLSVSDGTTPAELAE